jgi:WD40 repeat protein
LADVFISYAREDRDVVRRLTAILESRGRQSWVDWQDIEPSDTWWRSVTEAIDAADAIVFIASPDSLASVICQRELDHAVRQNKRLIAVVVREVEGLPIPEAISAVNWVFLRGQDDWKTGIVTLERALDLEIEFVRLHTRILTRAEAWRLSGRRPTPLLRGDELRAAELWVSRAAEGTEPKPTELQTEFVVASRQAASRRQRRAVTASLVIAVIAIGLSIFAFVQRAQARHQAQVAESRQLASSAEAELSSDPEQSIALASSGVRVQATSQAIHALSIALDTSRLRLDLLGPSPVTSLAFSPSGAELAIGSSDGAVRMWNLPDRRLLWTEGAGGPAVSSLSFAQSDDVLVVGRSSDSAPSGCSVNVLNVESGERVRALGSSGSGFCDQFAGFIGSGRDVAVASSDGVVQIWNVDSGLPVGGAAQVIQPADLPMSGLVISPDGLRLAIVGLHVVQVDSLSPFGLLTPITTLQSASGGFNPMDAAFSPDDNQFLVAGEYGTFLYSFSGQGISDLYAQDGPTQSAAWAGDGRVLAAAAGFSGVDVWSSSSRLVEVFHGGSTLPFSVVRFSSTGMLAGGSKDGSVRIWAPDPDRPDRTIPIPENSSANYAGGAPGVGLVGIGDARSTITLANKSGAAVGTISPDGDGPFAVGKQGVVAFTHEGTLIVSRLRSGRHLHTWKIQSGSAPAAISVSADGSKAAVISNTGSSGYLSRNGTITLASSRGTLTTTVPLGNDYSPGLSFSPDGRLLAVTVGSDVQILNTNNLSLERNLSGTAANFSTGGQLIAVQRPDLSIVILHSDDWQTQTVIDGEPVLASQLSFSPDDRLLAVLGDDGVLRIWDATDGTILATRQVIESGLTAQRAEVPPVVLTDAGFALVGVNAYDVCDQCLSADALLAQAHTRLDSIAAESVPKS